MIRFMLFLIVASNVLGAFARPQSDGFQCADLSSEGYSCVPVTKCKIASNKELLGQIFTDGSDQVEIRQDGVNPKDATCGNSIDIRNTDEVCCHKDDILEDTETEPKAVVLCDNFAEIGYKCVPSSECQLIKNQGEILGEIFTRQDENNPEDAVCSDPRQSSPAPRQSGSALVCCHEDKIVKEEVKEEIEECSRFSRDDFKCQLKTNCIDEFFKQSDRSNFNIRASKAKCPSADEICCHNVKPPEKPITQPKCSDNPGHKCVHLEECKEVGKLEEEPVLDIRQIDGLVELNANASICPVDDEICCVPMVKKVQPKTPDPIPSYASRCGTHNPEGLGFKINKGQDGEYATQFGEWPHACLVYKMNTLGSDEFIGGGSLIAPGIILTAAHKVEDVSATGIRVRCGEWNIFNELEQKLHQDRFVESVTIHPRYSGKKTVEHTVALLHLKTDFELAAHIDTICLPDFPNDRENNYQKSQCVVMGWGKDKFGEAGFFQQSLKQIDLPIIDNPLCQQQLRATPRLNNKWSLHQSFLCAGGEPGKDACSGDGGGPLVCKSSKSDRYVIAGIVAWGIGCGEKDVPGVYAAVADDLCFIDWATKCKAGNKYADFYDYPQCNNWIDKEISTPEQQYAAKARELKNSCVGLNLSNFEKRNGN